MAQESPKKKAPRAKPTHPPFISMAKEAIISVADSKGASVPAIQTYIAEKYVLDQDFIRVHLKRALKKGLEDEMFVRPKNSTSVGFTGRFKLNKVKAASEEKAKKEKEKEKAKKEKEKSKAVKTKAKATPTKSKTKKVAKKDAGKSPKGKKSAAASKAKATKKSPKKAAKPKAAGLKTPKKPLKKPKATPKASKSK